MNICATGAHGAGKSFTNRIFASQFPDHIVRHNETSHTHRAAQELGYKSSRDVPDDTSSIMEFQTVALNTLMRDLLRTRKLQTWVLYDRSPLDFAAYLADRLQDKPQRDNTQRLSRYKQTTALYTDIAVDGLVSYPPPTWGVRAADHRWNETRPLVEQQMEQMLSFWPPERPAVLLAQDHSLPLRLALMVYVLGQSDLADVMFPLPDFTAHLGRPAGVLALLSRVTTQPTSPCPACQGSTEVLEQQQWTSCPLCLGKGTWHLLEAPFDEAQEVLTKHWLTQMAGGTDVPTLSMDGVVEVLRRTPEASGEHAYDDT